MAKNIIYLDHNATTPTDKRVLDKIIPYFTEKFGNPSSIDHKFGNELLKDISEARENIAKLIHADHDDIFFTSGATESDNFALFGIAEAYKDKGKHIITTKIEHKAILESCQKLEENGFQVTYLDVDKYGYISMNDLENAIKEDTILISIMAVNNEIGTIQDLEKIGAIANKNDVIFHTDGAQAFGQIPIDVNKMNIHLLSISGHKIYAPKGIGVIYIRKSCNPRIKINPLFYGGGQEKSIRPGTHNVPGIIGLGEASRIAKEEIKKQGNIRKLKLKLFDNLKKKINVESNCDLENNLSNNLNIHLPNIEAKALLNLVKNDIAISAGSACTTENINASHVLLATGYDQERAFSSIRIGIGKFTTTEDIDKASKVIIEAIKKLNMFN